MDHTFIHNPHAPDVTRGFNSAAYFRRSDGSDLAYVVVRRLPGADAATLDITAFGQGNARADFLDADQCEALARTLIDAAHDLRTHLSVNKLHEVIVRTENAGGAA